MDGGSHLDCRHQGGVIVRTIVAYAIDEKRRCAIYAAAYVTHEIAAHLISVLARLKSIPYGCFGKPKLCADQEDVVMLSLLWFSNRASSISQNGPAAPANSVLSAAISACGCISVRGKCR